MCLGETRRRRTASSANRASLSARPSSWRTRYSSDPPTSPGTHHNRLTAIAGSTISTTPGTRPRSAAPSSAMSPDRRGQRPSVAKRLAASTRLDDAAGDVGRARAGRRAPRRHRRSLRSRAATGDHRRALDHRFEHRQSVSLTLARDSRRPRRRRTARRDRSAGTKPMNLMSPPDGMSTSPQPSAPATTSGSGSSSNATASASPRRFFRGSTVPTNSR